MERQMRAMLWRSWVKQCSETRWNGTDRQELAWERLSPERNCTGGVEQGCELTSKEMELHSSDTTRWGKAMGRKDKHGSGAEWSGTVWELL